jgi:hypothetical protein
MDKAEIRLFEDWFDPTNDEHLAAYRYLRENAMWPEGFKPTGMKIGPYWEERIKFKMIEELLDSRLGKSENS